MVEGYVSSKAVSGVLDSRIIDNGDLSIKWAFAFQELLFTVFKGISVFIGADTLCHKFGRLHFGALKRHVSTDIEILQ